MTSAEASSAGSWRSAAGVRRVAPGMCRPTPVSSERPNGSLLLHGPVFLLVAFGLCGAAEIAALLSRRRFRAGTRQSRGPALLGALVALALVAAALVGHPLVEWGRAWRSTERPA